MAEIWRRLIISLPDFEASFTGNWKRRLAGTGAKYIFTFGDGEEVHGKYIGRIPGYEGPIDGGNYLQVYIKQQATDATPHDA